MIASSTTDILTIIGGVAAGICSVIAALGTLLTNRRINTKNGRTIGMVAASVSQRSTDAAGMLTQIGLDTATPETVPAGPVPPVPVAPPVVPGAP